MLSLFTHRQSVQTRDRHLSPAARRALEEALKQDQGPVSIEVYSAADHAKSCLQCLHQIEYGPGLQAALFQLLRERRLIAA